MKKLLTVLTAAGILASAGSSVAFAKTIVKSDTDERGITTVTYDDGTTAVFYDDGVNNNPKTGIPSYVDPGKHKTPSKPKDIVSPTASKHVRVTVRDGGGRPVPGVKVDVMKNGVVVGTATTNVGGDAEVLNDKKEPVLFDKGDVVFFRVGNAPVDFKQLFDAGSVTVGDDLYTNGEITLPYKDDSRNAHIGKPGQDDKGQDNKGQDQKTKDAVDKAKQQAKSDAGKGKKSLPKTHAAK